jgi:hypothetical protein
MKCLVPFLSVSAANLDFADVWFPPGKDSIQEGDYTLLGQPCQGDGEERTVAVATEVA